jgi:2-amino-4-hydroxy-6-hydroxymethyldihydropteridine diphosphokinase
VTRYFLGLGSNIAPRRNLPLMLAALFELAPTLYVGRVLETAPVGVAGDSFLNVPICLRSDLTPEALKTWSNALEAHLGRDRAAPDSKHKSRTADLDLLFWLADDATFVAPDQLPTEPYMRPLLLELLAHLGITTEAEEPELGAGVQLELGGAAFGAGPTTIHRR